MAGPWAPAITLKQLQGTSCRFSSFSCAVCLLTIPLLIGITLVSFVIANAVPSDPVSANIPQNAFDNEEIIAAFRAKWGLDKPPHEQYLTYLGNLLRGDLGVSIKTSKPVLDDIRQFLPATIELAGFAILDWYGRWALAQVSFLPSGATVLPTISRVATWLSGSASPFSFWH